MASQSVVVFFWILGKRCSQVCFHEGKMQLDKCSRAWDFGAGNSWLGNSYHNMETCHCPALLQIYPSLVLVGNLWQLLAIYVDSVNWVLIQVFDAGVRLDGNSKSPHKDQHFFYQVLQRKEKTGDVRSQADSLTLEGAVSDPLCILTSSAAWGPMILYIFASFPDLQLAHISTLLGKDSLTFFLFEATAILIMSNL